MEIECNHCGWCCQRTTCLVGARYGSKTQGSCDYLIKVKDFEYKCGLLEKLPIEEVERIKHELFIGKGCTHKFGPHPISLMRQLIDHGLLVGSEKWYIAVEETTRELYQAIRETCEPASIQLALKDFLKYCSNRD